MFPYISRKYNNVLKTRINMPQLLHKSLDIKKLKRYFTNKSIVNNEKFWENYSKQKRKGDKYPALKSQEIKIYQTEKTWIFSDRFSIKNTELLELLNGIKKDESPPFLLIDIREESEFIIYKIPERNLKGGTIPIRYREAKEILTDYYDDFPVDKYLIVIDSIGLRSRRVAGFLLHEGYRAIYVEGGIDMFKPIAKDVLNYD